MSQRIISSESESGKALLKIGNRQDPFYHICRVAAFASIGLLIWVALQIAFAAWPAITTYGPSLMWSADWNPNSDKFGLMSFLLGTAISSVIAIALALPLGVFIAIFLNEDFLPMPVRQTVRFVIELLAAIPSVVYGLWGIAVMVPLVDSFGDWLQAKGMLSATSVVSGNSMLTASLVLAIMILPTITAISRNALSAVPNVLREGSYSLGATRWEAIMGVLLPSAAPGIVASAILALGRAMGETMAIAMLIGNSSRLSWSLFSPAGTLSGLLANQFGEATDMTLNTLMYAALILMLLTLGVNMLGDWVLRRAQQRVKGLI